MKANNRQAFTLVEMLVVMGIIVLAIALAVPALKYLTGSKSEQAAQNAVSAMLARARSDAVALQQPQGVLFTIDQANDRVTLYQVVQAFQQGGITFLDLTPDRDPLVLPPGVRAWTIKDTFVVPPAKDPFPNYTYLGFNNNTTGTASNAYTAIAVTDKALLGGVILFDAQGNLLVTPYGFRFMDTSVVPNVPTALSGILFSSVTKGITPVLPPGAPTIWPTLGAAPSFAPTFYLRSQVGLVLVDRESLQSQQPSTATSKDANTPGADASLDLWLNNNSTLLLVNRYSGTLTRAE